MEFGVNNSKLSQMNPMYGKTFEECDKNCRMMSFDPNFGDSIEPHIELFAIKMWKPINSVKLFTFNFETAQLSEVYEIPISNEHIDQLQNI